MKSLGSFGVQEFLNFFCFEVLCLDGIISLFETLNLSQIGEINTEKDVDAARGATDIIKKDTSGKSKFAFGYFTSSFFFLCVISSTLFLEHLIVFASQRMAVTFWQRGAQILFACTMPQKESL